MHGMSEPNARTGPLRMADVPARGDRRPVLGGLLVMVLLGACAGGSIHHRDGSSSVRTYAIANIAKADVDMVAELAQREVLKGLKRLALKLYRRNPEEFRKAGLTTPEKAVARVFEPLSRPDGFGRVDWMETVRLAFRAEYSGDRVHAYMSGVTAMVMAAYNHQSEFYVTDELDAQKLYNSARNLESAAWKLAQSHTGDGRPMLISNALEGEPVNLSFEREFGKIIAQQDLLALVIEDKSNRAINRVIHNVASFMLLPI